MGLETNHYYTADNLSRMVRRAFGTRYYNRITYSLESQPDGTNRIVYEVEENPLTFAKIGLNYNQFSGISAILNLTSRNFFTPTSRSLVTIEPGQNFPDQGRTPPVISAGARICIRPGNTVRQLPQHHL